MCLKQSELHLVLAEIITNTFVFIEWTLTTLPKGQKSLGF